MTDETRHWFAGVDWGSERHQACLLDAAGTVVGERAFAHDGAGLAALCDWLVSVAGHPGAVAAAIEVPHGPVVDTLLDRGFAVHAINPKQLDRLRDRSSVAGAKDDRRDARVAAAGLRSDPQLFRPLRVGDPAVLELREWSRLAEELQRERLRLANRVRQQLWRYYPQVLALTDDLTAEWILELWSLAPTPAEAARLGEATLARLLRQHRIRRLDAAGAVEVLRQPAIHVAAEPAGPCDADILRSLPGVGTIILAVLLTEAGDPLARRDYAALRTLSGVAPVTKRSGKTRIAVMRYAAQVRLRQAVFHWARVAIVRDPRSRSRYEALRRRGHPYGRALRGVADRLLGVACVLLRRKALFDPGHGAPMAA